MFAGVTYVVFVANAIVVDLKKAGYETNPLVDYWLDGYVVTRVPLTTLTLAGVAA